MANSLAAVYVAYGGVRTQKIIQKLTQIFGGQIPEISQPERAITYINQDP